MAQGILNPIKLRSLLPLLPAEREFARCLANGVVCTVGNGQRPNTPVARGNVANVVRSEVIRFFVYGGDAENPVLGPFIQLQGAWVSGQPMGLVDASIPYALYLIHSCFAVAVVMPDAECASLHMDGCHLKRGLMADGLKTKGGVSMCGIFAEGEVRLLRARIGGVLNCEGGKFHNPDGPALHADRMTVAGGVFLDGIDAEGEVRMRGARIDGSLNCVKGKIRNRNGFAFSADGMSATGGVLLRGFSADGEVRLSGARIGGNLDCDGGKFKNVDGCALSADKVLATGSVFLRNGFFAEGEVRLPGASIGRVLECVRGEFKNPNGMALFADGMTAKGGVLLRERFSAKGEVRLLGASIGGNLDCGGGNFHNPGDYDSRGHKKYALNAERMETGGHVYLNALVNPDGEKLQFLLAAHGRVRFANATIGGNFNCKGGQFLHSGKHSALAAGGLGSRGAVFLSDGFTAKGGVELHVARIGNFVCARCKPNDKSPTVINLSSTKAVAVDDDEQSWEPFQFLLDDFTYDAFFGAKTPKDESRRRWLAKRPKEMPSKDGEPVKVLFSPLPYEQAARVLRAMGKDIDAWDIEREKNRLQRESDGASPIRKLGGWFLDTLKDAVHRPLRMVKWAASVVALGAAVFAFADYHGNIVPTHPVVTLSEDYKAKVAPAGDLRPTRAVPPEYPAFNPVVFSLDVFTPAAVFHQEDSWGPRSGGGDWLSPEVGVLWLLTGWYWFQVAAGWVLVPLFVLSVTGVLRPRQSSGEKG